MRRIIFICCFLLVCMSKASPQSVFKSKKWEWHISDKGTVKSLIFKGDKQADTINFFNGAKFDGPSFYINQDGKERVGKWIPNGRGKYTTSVNGINCELVFLEYKSQPSIRITLRNDSHVLFQPTKAGLKLGIDIYMDRYPEWSAKYFPTLMRSEKTHFYGYLQTPNEHTLGLVSEQPIASWSLDYNLGYMDPAPHYFMGHRIESVNLDLINALPLPARHPQDLYELKKGEEKSWTISFVNIGKVGDLEQKINQSFDFPLIQLDKTSYFPGEKSVFEVYGDVSRVSIFDDQNQLIPTEIKKKSAQLYEVTTVLKNPGLYKVKAISNTKESEAVISVQHSWQWVMEQARKGVVKYHQKPTSHAESWYGYYTAFLAARYFPNKEIDAVNRTRFNQLFYALHDSTSLEPKHYPSRIQNTSTTIGMLVDKYQAEGDIEDLKKANVLADWLIRTSQGENGAYYNHKTIYTSVIYIAKSILELALVEKELGKKDTFWATAFQRHYDSAKKAIDQLIASKGNYDTEGEVTFDESTIACSALQMGMFATLQEDPKLRKFYQESMLEILHSHSCVTQLKVPDGRQRQGTMRFWEAQYDVQLLPNMLNSPHGWSAWRAYATYYAYLLTGEERWILETFNGMGAFSNLVDYKTGNLRWAFVPDPYIEAEQASSADTHFTFDSVTFGNPHPKLYDTRKFIVGEQYVDMVSDWQTVNTQDNDVHEVFKCIGETVLTNAFIVERANGDIVGYNCGVRKTGNSIEVEPNEKQIVNLHCNLKTKYTVKLKGSQPKSRSLPSNYLNWL